MFADYPYLSGNVYSFNIDVEHDDKDVSGTDERIGLTIVDVFRIFFYRIEIVTL